MSERDRVYTQLLHVGLMLVRQALDSGDTERARAESEFLHNLPSLIGEPNESRHLFFWEQERVAYLNWMRDKGSTEARSRMRTFHEPILDRLEPLIAGSEKRALEAG